MINFWYDAEIMQILRWMTKMKMCDTCGLYMNSDEQECEHATKMDFYWWYIKPKDGLRLLI